MQKIVPFLWFEDSKAEEAAKFYISIFKNSKIVKTPCDTGNPAPARKDQLCRLPSSSKDRNFMH